MGFQKTIGDKFEKAYEGDVVRGISTHYLTEQAKAEATIKVGGFASQGSKEGLVKPFGTSDKKVIGVVVKDRLYTSNVETMNVPVGEDLTILTHGVIAIRSDKTAVKGQAVWLDDSNGALAFDDSFTTKASHTFTGFKVVEGCTDNGIILIEK